MRIVLLHNPKAGQARLTPRDLIDAFAAEGHEASYHSTKEESCEKVLEREDADLVAAAGGDGTVRAVGRCLAGGDRQLMIIPCGTANNIAARLGIVTGSIETIARMDKLRERRLDVGTAEGPWGSERFFEGVGFGLLPQIIPFLKAEGRDCKFDDRYAKIAHHRKLFLRLLESFSASTWRFRVDGETIEKKCLLVEALNIGSVGPWLELAPGADPGDGRLDVVIVTEEARDTVVALLEGEIEAEEAARSFETARARNVEVEWDGSHVHIDSDIWAVGRHGLGKVKPLPSSGSTEVRINLDSHSLRVLAP